jgi:NAD(P)-dependent dehydrogenase (short-subunit alcohol dehydrogenase family)
VAGQAVGGNGGRLAPDKEVLEMATTLEQPMRGRTVLITGGTGGIGYQTARVLARWGAQVVITGREADAGERAAAAIRRESGNELADFLQADHATVGGNQRLADQVRAAFPTLSVLVNNVGGLYQTRWETADGYEATLAMNFVGPFALTGELLPLLQANATARCVNVVSAGFNMWKTDPFQDVQSTQRYVSGDVYAHTKLLNVLGSLALARRLPAEQVTVNLVHPGMAWTPMTQSMTAQTIPALRLVWPLARLMQRLGSPERAGRRVAALVASPLVAVTTGAYFEGKPRRLSARELDPQLQQRAWQLGCQLVAEAPTRLRVS